MINPSIFLTLCLCTITGLIYPQLSADSIDKHQNPEYTKVLLKIDDTKLSCLVFPPADSSVSTGLILIHEEWGLTDWFINFSSQIAAQGYLVIAPDLLSGLVSVSDTITDFSNEEIIRTKLLISGHERIRSALDESFEYLKANPLCNGKIAVIGFSWGGTQAFMYMTENENLTAGFIFYGRSPENNRELGRIKSPVYGIYGQYDTQLNNSLSATIRRMKRLGKDYQPFIIKGGGHGFMRSGERPGSTEDNTKARTAGWNKLMELLGQI
jgi:carboxymethylenebutenolidase